jgi:hypothetical protein
VKVAPLAVVAAIRFARGEFAADNSAHPTPHAGAGHFPSMRRFADAGPTQGPRKNAAPRAPRQRRAPQYAPSPRSTADTVRARSFRSRRSDHVAA